VTDNVTAARSSEWAQHFSNASCFKFYSHSCTSSLPSYFQVEATSTNRTNERSVNSSVTMYEDIVIILRLTVSV